MARGVPSFTTNLPVPDGVFSSADKHQRMYRYAADAWALHIPPRGIVFISLDIEDPVQSTFEVG